VKRAKEHWGDDSFDTINSNRHKKFSVVNTMEDVRNNGDSSTNQTTEMQGIDEIGKNSEQENDAFLQEIEMEMLDRTESNNKGLDLSAHRPNSVEEFKYYVGINRGLTKCNDDLIINYVNMEKILEYHLTKLGKVLNNGNCYIVIGFFTERKYDEFLKSSSITKSVGQFKPLY
jgi:hypothetical protein